MKMIQNSNRNKWSSPSTVNKGDFIAGELGGMINIYTFQTQNTTCGGTEEG